MESSEGRKGHFYARNQNTINNTNVNIYTQVSTKGKEKSEQKKKENTHPVNSQLNDIKRLLKNFKYAIEKYNEFKNDMIEIEQSKKRAERELLIHYQYKGSSHLTKQEDGIVADYKFIFEKEKSLHSKL